MTARICDILFPAAGDKHFNVAPSPVPELDGQVVQTIAEQLTAMTGQEPTMAEINNIVFDEAEKRAKKEAEDRLKGIFGKPKK
jgi:hypothetical protein